MILKEFFFSQIWRNISGCSLGHIFGSYHPTRQSDEYFFSHVKNILDIYFMIIFATLMINTCLLEILTQRSQNRVFHNFFSKWAQKILLRNLPVLTIFAGKNCVLLQPARMATWLLLAFFICLHCQLSSIHSVMTC